MKNSSPVHTDSFSKSFSFFCNQCFFSQISSTLLMYTSDTGLDVGNNKLRNLTVEVSVSEIRLLELIKLDWCQNGIDQATIAGSLLALEYKILRRVTVLFRYKQFHRGREPFCFNDYPVCHHYENSSLILDFHCYRQVSLLLHLIKETVK